MSPFDPEHSEDHSRGGALAGGHQPGGVDSGAAGGADDDGADETLVRPFVITGGRTRHATVHLRVESLVVATGLQPPSGLQFEHAAILDVCRQPISVAEVAARIDVPLGVAQILVGDLADVGLVRVHEATPNATPALLLRMIDAVRAL
ncbi:MAG: DUF742 domain-containing protein [Microthrixaceae bacterium]